MADRNSTPAELISDAQSSARTGGEFIRLSPDHDEPGDAEVYLDCIRECMSGALGGWKSPAFIAWEEAFFIACQSNADVRAALKGINNGSVYLLRTADADEDYDDAVRGNDTWWNQASYIDAQLDGQPE